MHPQAPLRKQCPEKVNQRNVKAAGAQSRRLRRRWRPSRVQTVASEQTTTPSQPAFLTFSSITQRHVYLSLLLPNYRVETERGRASGAPEQLASWRVNAIELKMLRMSISWEMKGRRRTASYAMTDSVEGRFCVHTAIDNLAWICIVDSENSTALFPREHLNTQCQANTVQ